MFITVLYWAYVRRHLYIYVYCTCPAKFSAPPCWDNRIFSLELQEQKFASKDIYFAYVLSTCPTLSHRSRCFLLIPLLSCFLQTVFWLVVCLIYLYLLYILSNCNLQASADRGNGGNIGGCYKINKMAGCVESESV